DAPAVVVVLADELADVAVPAAVHGGLQVAGRRADPVDGPAPRREVEGAHGHALAAPALEGDLVDRDLAVEVRPGLHHGVEAVPVLALRMARAQAPVGDAPAADEEVEIVG